MIKKAEKKMIWLRWESNHVQQIEIIPKNNLCLNTDHTPETSAELRQRMDFRLDGDYVLRSLLQRWSSSPRRVQGRR